MKKLLFFILLISFFSINLKAQTIIDEGFETWPPNGWTVKTTSSPDALTDWSQSNCGKENYGNYPGKAYQGTYAACRAMGNMWLHKDYSMITPIIDLSTLQNPVLSFYWWHYIGETNPYKVNLDIYVSFSSDPQDTNFLHLERIKNLNGKWVKFERGLNKGVKRVKISTNRATSSMSNIYIDAFSIKESVFPCGSPLDLHYTLNKDRGALLQWDVPNAENKWNIKVASSAIDPKTQGGDILDTLGVESKSLILSNITFGNTYYWYVQTNCGESKSAWIQGKKIIVDQLPVELPYEANFNNDSEDFTFVQEGQKNQWVRGDLPYEGSSDRSACLFVSSSEGGEYSYSNEKKDRSHIYREIIFPEGEKNGFEVRFDFKGVGTVYNHVMKVYLITDMDYYPKAGEWIDGEYQKGIYYNLTPDWKTFNIELPPSFAGKRARLAFSWMNNMDEQVSNPPAAIDNLIVRALACPSPQNVRLTEVTQTTASIEWSQAGVSSSSWIIEYGPLGFTLGTGTEISSSERSYTIEGLTEATRYEIYVKSVCEGNLESMPSAKLDVITVCEAKTAPFSDNFDDLTFGQFPLCWTSSIPGTAWLITENPGYAHSLPNAMMLGTNEGGGVFRALISPELSDLGDRNKRIRFWAKIWPMLDLGVGVMSDRNDPNTYIPLKNIQGIDYIVINEQGIPDAMMRQHSIDLTDERITEEHKYIAFTLPVQNQVEMKVISLDDLEYELIPDCAEPANITLSNVGTNSVDLSWNSRKEEKKWDVAICEKGKNPATAERVITFTDTIVRLELLDDNTSYDLFFRAICNGSEVGSWSTPFFVKTCAFTIPPFLENFDSFRAGNLPECWGEKINEGTATWSISDRVFFSRPYSLYLPKTSVAQDQWLFVPAFKLQAGEEYMITFQYKSMSKSNTPTKEPLLSLYMSAENTEESMLKTTPLWVFDSISTLEYQIARIMVKPNESGSYYLGFHHKTEFSLGLSIDDLGVMENFLDIESSADAKNKIHIYPNPVKDVVNIQFEGSCSLLLLTDATGRIVRRIANYTSGTEIYVGDINNGIYMVSIMQQQGIRSAKLVINNY